ncbi:hypothetical protein [Spirosoma rigui]|nr:hypothetical protein [Spirosoma rigui]
MIPSLLAVLLTLPFIAVALLAFNIWKLVRMIQERLQTEGLLT